MVICHLCQQEIDENVALIDDDGDYWCPPENIPDCNDEARARLGVPFKVRLRFKALDLAALAERIQKEADRAHAISEWLGKNPPKPINRELLDRYRRSDWPEVREAIFRRDKYICQNPKCRRRKNANNLQAHHLTYRRLGHELPEDLQTLCSDCHLIYRAKDIPELKEAANGKHTAN